ncbi:hypothetical protein [Nocardia tengchongensis]|uniref:hypothetical protein n=1 Tax=Nocardia tengchongensis TaxID=2055889 RepID=UPI0036C53893
MTSTPLRQFTSAVATALGADWRAEFIDASNNDAYLLGPDRQRLRLTVALTDTQVRVNIHGEFDEDLPSANHGPHKLTTRLDERADVVANQIRNHLTGPNCTYAYALAQAAAAPADAYPTDTPDPENHTMPVDLRTFGFDLACALTTTTEQEWSVTASSADPFGVTLIGPAPLRIELCFDTDDAVRAIASLWDTDPSLHPYRDPNQPKLFKTVLNPHASATDLADQVRDTFLDGEDGQPHHYRAAVAGAQQRKTAEEQTTRERIALSESMARETHSAAITDKRTSPTAIEYPCLRAWIGVDTGRPIIDPDGKPSPGIRVEITAPDDYEDDITAAVRYLLAVIREAHTH